MRVSKQLVSLSAVAIVCSAASARQVLEPPFDASYVLVDLGLIPGVPTPYGGLTLLPGEPNTLLICGSANGEFGEIYSIELERSCGQITGFIGEAKFFADAPFNDGGLAFHPTGVLFYTQYPTNLLGQIRPGSSMVDKVIDLTPLGVDGSVGACQFVPGGLPGAGGFKVASYSPGVWHDISLAPDGTGLFDITAVGGGIALPGGPEGIVYVAAGSAQFPNASILLSEWSAGQVEAFEVDANGDPDPGTARLFISGLSGAEGAHVDAITGDFLFSTFGGGDRVVIVRGFKKPCPGDANGDALVNFVDLNIVLGFFGMSGASIQGDVNNDCVVDFLDLNIVLSAFGNVCAAR